MKPTRAAKSRCRYNTQGVGRRPAVGTSFQLARMNGQVGNLPPRTRGGTIDDNEEPSSHRETCLVVMLTGLFGILCFVMLAVLTGGLFIYLALTVAGLGLFGLCHYLLWGWGMERKVAADREEQQIQQEAGEKDSPPEESD